LNWGPLSGSFSTNYNMGTVSWQNNIVAHSSRDSTSNYFGIYLDNGYVGSITNNILYDWQAPLLTYPAGAVVSGNVQDAAGTNSAGYPDPNRTVGSYAGTLGLTATTDAFLAAARLQSKDNWKPQLMAAAVNSYIAAGFGFSSWPTTGTPAPAPAPPPPTTAVPPPVPTGLTGALTASTQINLGWNASSNATGYKVFRNGNNVGVATTTSYQDTGLSTGTTYSYTVSAYDSVGSSAQSAPVTVSTPSAPVVTPSAPVVTITSPANGASIKGNGSVNIAASATDATGLKSITIQGDSTILQTCLNATSCSVTWQGKAVTRGTHTITAIVVDAAGLQATASVSIVAAK